MESFTVVDAATIAVILLSAILAYSRGLTREALSIIGWVASIVLAYKFTPAAQPLVIQIPAVGGFLSNNCELAAITTFLLIFVAILMLMALLSPSLSNLVVRSFMGNVDQALGFLFGAIRGVLLVVVALIFYDKFVSENTFPVVDRSNTVGIFSGLQSGIEALFPQDAPEWLTVHYEFLTINCHATETDESQGSDI